MRPPCFIETSAARLVSRCACAEWRQISKVSAPEPWFMDVTGLLQHIHVETAFDDFARQPLLSRKLSQLGPGVSWFDVDGDGWEDAIIAGGRGGRLSVFLNDGKGGFKPLHQT